MLARHGSTVLRGNRDSPLGKKSGRSMPGLPNDDTSLASGSQSSKSGVLSAASFTNGAGASILLSPGYGRFQSVAEYQMT
jgi:hypothetical protein